MKVEKKGNTLVITIDLQEPKASASGKTMVVASSGGNQRTAVEIDGKVVTVGVNAYVTK